VAGVVPRASLLCAPLGAVHADHALVRRYATAVAARAGVPLRIYADVPYSTRLGWPYWVTGDAPNPRLDVDAHWAMLLDGIKEIADHRSARVVRLPPNAAAAKLAAMRTYATQLSGLDGGPLRIVTSPAVHPFEVFWDLAPS
jgi:LmbE family N-acetylglucosaminyl deacetylase